MGMIFHNEQIKEPNKTSEKEVGALMLAPVGVLAALTIAIGLIGPWVSEFLSNVFKTYFTESLHLTVASSSISGITGSTPLFLEIAIAIVSISTVLIGLIPGYRLFISHRANPESIISNHLTLQGIYKFLWNRWYIEAFYNKVFVDGVFSMKDFAARFIERPLDLALNVGVPRGFAGLHRGLKKIQTGILTVNMLYFIGLIVVVLLFFWLRLL
jgi:NADH-quinone oxidoreductase subunit L